MQHNSLFPIDPVAATETQRPVGRLIAGIFVFLTITLGSASAFISAMGG
jgi:hypothetical protein